MSGIVEPVRRKWSTLRPEEKTRFAAAIATMQKGGQSANAPYWKMASQHGWPSKQPDGTPNICAHRIQTFPTWHRPFLLDFERALQQADKDNGRDGKIWLPYWNWTVDQTLPAEFRSDPRLSRLPTGFFSEPQPEADFPETLDDLDIENARYDDDNVTATLERVVGMVQTSLALSEWRVFSTTGTGQGDDWQPDSLENPHDWVHGAVNGIMGDPATSAFDPIFWLHHCNIDRLYEAYLRKRPKSEKQSAELGQEEETAGKPNRYTTPLIPFKHSDGKDWMPTETFQNCETLGYKYDDLPDVPNLSTARAMMMRKKGPPPAMAVFSKINLPDLGPHSLQLHVFLVTTKFPPPEVKPVPLAELFALPNYAGGAMLFTGNPGCVACKESEPLTRTVELDAALARIGASRDSVGLFVIAINSKGEWQHLSTTGIAPPILQLPEEKVPSAPKRARAQSANKEPPAKVGRRGKDKPVVEKAESAKPASKKGTSKKSEAEPAGKKSAGNSKKAGSKKVESKKKAGKRGR